MNETLHLADFLLSEALTPMSNDELTKIYALAYPERIRHSSPADLYGLTRESMVAAILDAVKDDASYTAMVAVHGNDENELLAAADRIIRKPGFTRSASASPTGSTSGTSGTSSPYGTGDEPQGEVKKAKWPKYKEMRKKWYQDTVDLGWPADVRPGIRNVMISGKTIFPWSDADQTVYVFNPKGLGRVSIFSTYVTDIKNALYHEFKDDVQRLRVLSNKVDAIIRVDQEYRKTPLAVSILGFLVKQAFKGMGGHGVEDSAFVNFMLKKIKGMTIFEFQSMILNEMLTKMDLDDTTLSDIKGILQPLRTLVINRLPLYTPTKITADSIHNRGYVCSFKIELKKKTKDVFSGQAYYDMMKEIAKPLSEGKLTNKPYDDGPTTEQIDKIMNDLLKIKSKDPRPTDQEILNKLTKVRFIKTRKTNNKSNGEFHIEFKFKGYTSIVEVSYIPEGVSYE